MGFWGWFYAVAVVATILNTVLPIRPNRFRNITQGAEIIAFSWVGAYAVRGIFNDPTPLVAYSMIDLFAAGLFYRIAREHQAAWAAVCAIIHGLLMCSLHLIYLVIGEPNDNAYIWVLNSLFVASLITINSAAFSSRHQWGDSWDDFVYSVFAGWSWSGHIRFVAADCHKENS